MLNVPRLLTLQLETITHCGGRFTKLTRGCEPSFETRVILTLALQMLKNDDVLHYATFRAHVKCYAAHTLMLQTSRDVYRWSIILYFR